MCRASVSLFVVSGVCFQLLFLHQSSWMGLIHLSVVDGVFWVCFDRALLLSHLSSVPILAVVVRRARRSLDFTATFYLIHFVSCLVVGKQFPVSLSWWIAVIAGGGVMAIVGEQVCMAIEMRDITFGVNQNDIIALGNR